MLLLAGCTAGTVEGPGVVPDGVDDTDPAGDTDVASEGDPLPWDDDPCAAIDPAGNVFAADVGRFTASDARGAPAAGQLVAVGSSSMRRWAGAAQALARWGVVQRGFGGARMLDVAAFVPELVLAHRPAGVLVFAGTNDVATGVATDAVVDGYRCLVQQVFDALGPTPVVYVGITPTPSRWAVWDDAVAVDTRIAALAAQHPALSFVDLATPFLATGQPPRADLFVGDQLHLSVDGYALWTEAILPVLRAAVPERTVPVATAWPSPTRWRVDLGPSNPEDGRVLAGADGFGITWNTWPGAVGSGQVLAGEALRGLRTTTGEASDVDLIVAGGFRANGLRNGGLTAPTGERLGTLAVPEATADFFYTEGPDDPAALAFAGLEPDGTYTLRLFASRADAERRVTTYVVTGSGPARAGALVTSGTGVGTAGGNDGDLVVLSGLRPDAWGQLYLDVQRTEGAYAYLSLLELERE